MRVRLAALLTVTALATQGLTPAVSATQDSQIPLPASQTGNFVVDPALPAPAATAEVPQLVAAAVPPAPPSFNSPVGQDYSAIAPGNAYTSRDPQAYVVQPVGETDRAGIESRVASVPEAVAYNSLPSPNLEPDGGFARAEDATSFIVEPQQLVAANGFDASQSARVLADVAMPVLPPMRSPAPIAAVAYANPSPAQLLKPAGSSTALVASASSLVAPPDTRVVAAREVPPPTRAEVSQASLLIASSSGAIAAQPYIVEPQPTAVSQLPIPTPPPPPAQNLPPAPTITSPAPQPTQTRPAPRPTPPKPSLEEVRNLRNRLLDVDEKLDVLNDRYKASPSLTIVNPAGYGADNNTGYVAATLQSRTRYTNDADGGLVVGVGLGNARKNIGVELSYTTASFGSSRDFGAGGFNVKLHRQFSDDFSVAAGWNGIINVGGFRDEAFRNSDLPPNDFKNSIYASATKIFRTREDISKPFSRVAVTAGLGSGRFRSEDDVANDRNTVNPFGSVAIRVAEPVSAIVEWTGQDLAVGASIVPFKNVPFVITPALRDIAGAGDGARFVVGAGFSFKF